MDVNDCESPFLYKLGTLQKVRQQGKYERLGIKSKSDIFTSLECLKHEDPVCGKYIKKIGYDKFFVTYWSQDQVEVHNDIYAKFQNPLSLDATGSIAIKIDFGEIKSSHIFLSVLCTYVNNTIFPLTQVFSELNDANFVNYWLSDWIKSGAKIPMEVVTDMGDALRIGLCMAFNTISFDTYNEQCLLILQEKEHIKLKTQLRTDITHLVHAVKKLFVQKVYYNKQKRLNLKVTALMTINNFFISNYNRSVTIMHVNLKKKIKFT